MRLSKSIQIMTLVTGMSLIYTHLQMQIYDLAYRGTKKEKVINDIAGNNSMIAYDIMKMKSSQNLGGTFLAEDSNLEFGDEANVVQLVAAMPDDDGISTAAVSPARASNPLLSYLSLRADAQAAAAEQRSTSRPGEKTR